MTHPKQRFSVLRALYDLGRVDVPATVPTLVALLGLSESRLRSDLTQLQREGWVDAVQLRLTLPGLVVAANLGELSVQASLSVTRGLAA
jgi:hypothetical protein